MKFAIIGTAGRGDDGDCLRSDSGYWRTMCAVAQITATLLKPEWVVSGGAAYADHCAVWLYLEGLVPNLSLHLPAAWTGKAFQSTVKANSPGNVANYYHSLFSRYQALDSLGQIQKAIDKGATIQVNTVGFKARNTDVANEADALLAYTFGTGAWVKDGGTFDTVEKFLAKRNGEKARNYPAYHFCLNQKRLYSL